MGTAAQSNKGREKVRFGVFEADLRTGELFRDGIRVRLQQQPFQVLAVLLENPGELVTREELRSRLWRADTFVDFDHSLNAAIRRLRDTLGDSAENPRFVATVARRGYRFLAPVKRDLAEVSPAKAEPVRRGGYARPFKPGLWFLAVLGPILMVAVGIGLFWVGPTTAAKPSSKRRLTANPTDIPVRMSGLSPDGRHLVFVDSTGFYVRNVTTGETHSLGLPRRFGLPDSALDPFMTPGKADAPIASWLPDNEHFVLAWPLAAHASTGIWEVSAVGGVPRKIAEHGFDPAVSPDGTQMVFVIANGLNWELWLAGNGENRKLAGYHEGDILGTPAWSPDGKHVALAVCLYDNDVIVRTNVQIDVIDVSTGSVVTILRQPGLGLCVGWTPDNRIIYSQQEAPPNQADSNLWAISLDRIATRTTGKPVRLTDDSGSVASISLSRDGKRLAYSKLTIQPDVYVADVLAKGTKLAAPRRLTLDERQDYPWEWSRDSESVIFTSDRNGTFNIFRQGIKSVEPELLVGGDEQLYVPRLSSDGSMLLYLATSSAGATPVRLMRMPIGGGTPELVYEDRSIANFQCARLPSVTCLLGKLHGDKLQFFFFDPVKGIGSRVANIESSDSNWSLAPDGRVLAVSEDTQGSVQSPFLRLIDLRDAHESIIPLTGWDGIRAFDWTPDSKSFWVSSSKSGRSTLLSVDLKGRIRPMLSEQNMSLGWAVASPDNRHIAFWQNSGTVNVWLLENF